MAKKTDYKQLWRREKVKNRTISSHNRALLDAIAQVCSGQLSVEKLKVLYGFRGVTLKQRKDSDATKNAKTTK